jgi:hypothetical protein
VSPQALMIAHRNHSKTSAAQKLLTISCIKVLTVARYVLDFELDLADGMTRFHVSDTDWYPNGGILSVMAIFQQLTEPRDF